MKHHISLLITVVFSLFFLITTNFAVAGPYTIKVAFTESPPAKMLGSNGEPTGIDTEFVEELAHRLGLQVEYDIVPFKRGLAMLKNGSSDLMTGVLMREDREEYLHFLQPPYRHNTDKVFYVRKGDENRILSHKDLYKLTVATVLGVRYFPAFDSDPQINKLKVSDPNAVFAVLVAGRVETAVSSEFSGDYRIAELGLTNQIGKAKYAYREEQDVFFALSKSSPFVPMLPQIQAEMNKMIEEGVYEQIIKKYLYPQSPKIDVYR